jgi:hypothetical protein
VPTNVTKVRIFVASPGDCNSERQQLDKVVAELNVILPALVPDQSLILELVKWETAVTPGIGRDAQEVVNRQIGEYDIFIGILWKRMGTPTAVASSGTEEEYRNAYAVWEKDRKLPILFYFSQEPYLIKTPEDASQLQKVLAFRDELSKHGLVWDYPGSGCFADVIRPHLALVLGRRFTEQSGPEAAHSVQKLTLGPGQANVSSKVHALADEYVNLRAQMPAGDERTRRMSAIAAQLRSLAVPAYDLLPELIVSASAGERLAAVSILQQVPGLRYLYWLAERVATEKPFIAYQATVALLLAVRSAPDESASQMAAVLQRAKEFLLERKYQDPNQASVLRNAESELAAVRSG